MSIFLELTKDERFAVGRAFLLRRVPFVRWVSMKFVYDLVAEDATTVDKTDVLVDSRNGLGKTLTGWLGAEWRFFMHQLVVEGAVEFRVTEVRMPRAKAPKKGYKRRPFIFLTETEYVEAYQPIRKENIKEIRASDLATIYDDYMPKKSADALAQLPMSSLTLLQLIAQAAEVEVEEGA